MNDFAIQSSPSSSIPIPNAEPVASGMPAAAGATDTTGLAEFNERAGVHGGRKAHHVVVPLARRQLRQAPSRAPRRPSSGQNAAAHLDDHDHLGAAGMDLVHSLARGDNAELENTLAHTYDALERHALLRNARSQVDDTSLDQAEKEKLKSRLNEMLSDLMDTHGDVIRAGLKNAEHYETALEQMDALAKAGGEKYDPNSLRELRNQYGAKREGKLDAPLTPLALAKSLQDKFGVDNFTRALGDLRSKMSTEFRSRPERSATPRLWLSLADAAAFNAVQTCLSIGNDLRRDLSERVGVLLKTNQAATAMAFLGVAELGVTRGEAFVAHLIDINNYKLPNLKRVQLYMLIRRAVEKMAITMWRTDMLPQRMTLLDELRTLAFSASAEEKAIAHDEIELEERLRGKVTRRDGQRQGGGQDQSEQSDDSNEGHDGSNSNDKVEVS